MVPLSLAAVSLVSHFPWLVGCPLPVWGISGGCLLSTCQRVFLLLWKVHFLGRCQVRSQSEVLAGVRCVEWIRHLSRDQRNGNVHSILRAVRGEGWLSMQRFTSSWELLAVSRSKRRNNSVRSRNILMISWRPPDRGFRLPLMVSACSGRPGQEVTMGQKPEETPSGARSLKPPSAQRPCSG